MSEEVNVKSHKIFPVAHQFLCSDVFLYMSRKHTNPICGKVVSWYGLLDTSLKCFLPLLLSNDNYL